MAKRSRLFNVVIFYILIAVMSVTICGCYGNRDDKVYKINKNDYAVIYDRAVTYAKESFIETHLTQRSAGDQDSYEQYPKTYCILVGNENDYNEIFNEFLDDIDFDKEMIIVYCFSCIYNGCGYKIRNINSAGESMIIVISHIPPSSYSCGGLKYTSAPTYRIIAIKTSVTGLKSVNITED